MATPPTGRPAIPDIRSLEGVAGLRQLQTIIDAIRNRLGVMESFATAVNGVISGLQTAQSKTVAAAAVSTPTTPIPVPVTNLDDAFAALGWPQDSSDAAVSDALDEALAAVGWREDQPPVARDTGVTAAWPGPLANIPKGWLLADGTTVLIADYPDLFAAIGITWGGNGTTNFALPALTDRYLIGVSGAHAVGSLFGNADHEIDVKHRHAASDGGGALVNAAAGDHTHGVGGVSTVSAGDHSHGGGTGLNDTVQEVQSGSGQFVAGAGHTHAVSTSVNGAHSHAVSGATDGAGAHNHTISGNTAEALITKVNIQPLTAAVYWIIKT